MRFVTIALLALCLGVLCMALPVSAAMVTSSFNNYVYDYTVTPAPGEAIKDFHVYAGVGECSPTEYTNIVMPVGWNFTLTSLPDKCVITWWTTGNPLPVGVASAFGYKHYCAPCCHSWLVTGTGTSNPFDPPIDGSWNHLTEPCNIPSPFNDQCGGGGLVVAPIYPQQTPVDTGTWGRIKVLYR
jgi:hypothetical protein